MFKANLGGSGVQGPRLQRVAGQPRLREILSQTTITNKQKANKNRKGGQPSRTSLLMKRHVISRRRVSVTFKESNQNRIASPLCFFSHYIKRKRKLGGFSKSQPR